MHRRPLFLLAFALPFGLWSCSGMSGGIGGGAALGPNAAQQNPSSDSGQDSEKSSDSNEAEAIYRNGAGGLPVERVALADGISGARQGNEGQVVEKPATYLVHVSNVDGIVDQSSGDEGDSECFTQAYDGELLPIPALFPPGAPFSADYARPVVKMLGSQDADPNFPHIYFVDRCGRTTVTYPYLKNPEDKGLGEPPPPCDHSMEIWASFETEAPKTSYQSPKVKISCPDGGTYPQSLVLEKTPPLKILKNRTPVYRGPTL